MQGVDTVEGIEYIKFDYIPAALVEVICETIGPRCLAIWEAFVRILDFSLAERSVKLQSRQLL